MTNLKSDAASTVTVEAAFIEELEGRGYRVSRDLPHEPRINIPAEPGQVYKMAVVSCTHFGNVAQQLSALHDFCVRAARRGCKDFWHTGDIVDGSDKMHPDAPYEHFKHGASAQVNYAAEVLPKIGGGRWWIIDGNHDESFLKDNGFVVGAALAEKREDVTYLGRRAAQITVGGVRIYSMHKGGGPAYARSYRLQKIIEQFRGDDRRPHLAIVGGDHLACHVPAYLGVDGFLLPCFEAQTPYMKGKGISPVIGGVYLEFEVGSAAGGPRNVQVEWWTYHATEQDY